MITLQNFFSQINYNQSPLSPETALAIFFTSLCIGVIISLVYMFTHKETGYSKSFSIVNLILPPIIAIIIMLVGNNIARAFSLAGIFSLVRFRSTPGEPRDLTFVLFTIGMGLACGIGFLGYAVLFTVLISILLIIIYKTKFGTQKKTAMLLRIVIPEDLNYMGAFDDLFEEYTLFYKLTKVKTSGYGTMYELYYRIRVDKNFKQKDFIDKIRSRNGNLNVYLNLDATDDIQGEW